MGTPYWYREEPKVTETFGEIRWNSIGYRIISVFNGHWKPCTRITVTVINGWDNSKNNFLWESDKNSRK